MNGRPLIEEKYTKGSDVIYYIVYQRTTGKGNDEILQHQLFGTTETAHITVHPDGTVNFRVKRTKTYLENAVRTDLMGYYPSPSASVREFLSKIYGKI